MKKFFKIVIKTLATLLLLLILLIAGTYVYFSVNKNALNRLLVAQLQKTLNGHVSVGSTQVNLFARFPNVSLELKDVLITDSLYGQHHRAFLKASAVQATLPFSAVFNKNEMPSQLTISRGVIHLFTDENGQSNQSIFAKVANRQSGKVPVSKWINLLHLKEVVIRWEDLQKQKNHAINIHQLQLRPIKAGHSLMLDTRLDATVEQLSFNTNKGAFLHQADVQGRFSLQLKNKHLLFDSIQVLVNKHPFTLWGNFDISNKPAAAFSISASVNNILLDTAKALLTKSISHKLDIVKMDKPLDARATISGWLQQGNPLVVLQWQSKNTAISSDAIQLDSATLTGSFTNEFIKGGARNDSNSQITIQQMKAQWRGLPLKFDKIAISNLSNPVLQTQLADSFNLSWLKDIIPIQTASFKSGKAVVDISYNGPINKGTAFLKHTNATIKIYEAALQHGLSNRMVTHINGLLVIKNAAINIPRLQFYTANRQVNIMGRLSVSTTQVANNGKSRNVLTGIALNNADVQVFTHGGVRAHFGQQTAAFAAGTRENYLKTIALNNVRLRITDRRHHKQHDAVIKYLHIHPVFKNNKTVLNAQAHIKLGQLTFNSHKGSYLTNVTLTGPLQAELTTHKLSILQSRLRLDNHPINFSASFYLNRPLPRFDVKISTSNIDYAKASPWLTDSLAKRLSMVQLKGPLNVAAHIAGPLTAGEPFIYVKASATNAELATPFFDFCEAGFSGYFTNQWDKTKGFSDENSAIVLQPLVARWNQMPVQFSQLEIVNLTHPQLQARLSSIIPLPLLGRELKSKTLQLQSGTARVSLQYQGPIERSALTNALLHATLDIDSGQIFYQPRQVPLTEVYGRLRFSNTDLYVENLQCKLLNTAVKMNGVGKQFLSLINTDPNNAQIKWNIYAPSINLADFLFLLKKKTAHDLPATDSSRLAPTLQDVANKIDRLLDKGALNVQLQSDQLIYKNFRADSLFTNITLLQDKYEIHRASMQHAEGFVHASGSLTQLPNGLNNAQVKVDFTGVDVAAVFSAFENFGQTGLLASNIEGRLTAGLTAGMMMADSGRIIPESIQSNIYFSLKNGALKNFEPIKKLKRFVLKKRNFDRIAFAELKDSLFVRNKEIIIPRMEIQSTVLSLFAQGIYSMQGNTDINIQLPLSNLKKRGAGFILQNIGLHARAGRSIFLRGRPGPDGNIKFKLDLKKKFFKDPKIITDLLPYNYN